MKGLYQNPFFATLVLGLLAITSVKAGAQALKIRSNSEKKLKITAFGVNKEGKQVSVELNDVDLGYWKTLSLYKAKYGFDNYNNQNMKKSGADISNHWTSMVIEVRGTDRKDEIDLTQDVAEVKLKTTKLWLRVQQKFDQDYQLTTVSMYDKHE
jgi:hypothetical protein